MISNLFADLPDLLAEELTDVLVSDGRIRIERIVSLGQASPPGFWYDQAEHEWVAVLQGEAGLIFEGDRTPISLTPGDFVLIPAGRRHRVEWTTPDEPTIWLAVFFNSETPVAVGESGGRD